MSDLPAEIKVWFSRYPIDYMGTWATTRYPAEAVTYVPKADAEAAVALALEEAAENKEQLEIWAHEILAGLAFADVLKIDSYNDKIEAHDMVGRGLVEVIRALAPADGLAAVDALRAEIADLKMNMDADLRTMVREGQQLRTLAAELAAAQQREAELRGALEMSRQGWRNALELDLLPKQHRHSAKTMADIADAALASVDGLAMVQELRAEMDTLAAENASLKAAKAVAG